MSSASVLVSAVALLAAPRPQQPPTLDARPEPVLKDHPFAAGEPRPLIFIHIAKTGGTSIGVSLGLDVVDGYTSIPECDSVPWLMKHRKHDTASAALKNNYTQREWDNAYKFSFVRNPWERIVSEWAMRTDAAGPAVGCDDTDQCADIKPCPLSNVTSDDAAARGILDVSVGDDLYTCPFTCWFENACYNLAGAGASIIDQLEYFVSPEVAARATSSNARQLLYEESMVDFIGREENLTSHFYLALLGAGNNESVASACANNLAYVVEGSAGHDDYELYYRDLPVHDLGEHIYGVDDSVFNYTFGVAGPYDVIYSSGAISGDSASPGSSS